MCACICGYVCTCMNVCAFVHICKCSYLLWVSSECWLPGVAELLMEAMVNLSPEFLLSLWGVLVRFCFCFILNDCFSLAVFMGLLKLLVCPWFNFGRSHISRGLFISFRLPDSFEICVFKVFPNNFLDFIGVQ